MNINKQEAEHFSKNSFKILNVKTLLLENSIFGSEVVVFLKDENSVDEFSEWCKKELLKIKSQ